MIKYIYLSPKAGIILNKATPPFKPVRTRAKTGPKQGCSPRVLLLFHIKWQERQGGPKKYNTQKRANTTKTT